MQIPFATQSYQSRSLPLSAQRLVNSYTQKLTQGKSQMPVFRCPGIITQHTFSQDIRGAIFTGATLYVIAGQTAYIVDALGVQTSIGTIPGVSPVSLAHDGTNVVCVAEGNGYVLKSSVVQISDPDFVPALQVVWLDRFFVFLGLDKTFASDYNDPLSFDALAYDQQIGSPDSTVAIIADSGDLVHFGTNSLEIWYNKGTSPYAFGRAPDGLIERGCIASRSPVKGDQSVWWLADDLTVRVLRGNTPERKSTEVIEQTWASYPKISIESAYGLFLSLDGRFSYVLTFPGQGTWEYSIATDLWNERQSYHTNDWGVGGSVVAYGKTYVWKGPELGYFSTSTHTEFGAIQRTIMTSPPIADGVSSVQHSRLEIEAQMGVGLPVGQGSVPQLMLRYSDDGGNNWSNEYSRSLGKTGRTQARALWTRLGRSRNRIYELSYTDPTPEVIYAAWLNEEQAVAA